MIGKSILHYRILEKLGGGGMGIVYKAEDTKLERTVALKFLPPEWTRDENAKARFLHEAKAASKLDHTNICTIYEIGETDDSQLFIAMALYEGETLKDKIEQGPLKIDEAIDITNQIAQGLVKAHENEIVHRDIKPANVVITKDGLVKILDFGLAKLAGQTLLTKEGTTLGTVTYMSPEQGQSEDTDRRTDIWSLGVVVYEMITGKQPFQGDYEQAVMYSIMNEDPVPPTALRTGVPMELERIMLKALAKKADERYQHVQDVLVDLKRVQKTQESRISSTKTNSTETMLQDNKRFKPFLLGVFLVLILLVVVTGMIFFSMQRDKPIDSIAVLPFININNDPDLEYLGDGLTETLINKLSQLPQLRVMARSTVFHYKGKSISPQQVGKELDVKAVFVGEIVQRGEALRIHTELVNVSDGTQIWGQQYHRILDNLFAVQDTISEQITANLRLKLNRNEKNKLSSRDTENPEAYQLYLRGRYFWNKRTQDGFSKSISYFQQAIESDPTFAPAYAGLADAYITLADHFMIPPHEAFPKARSAAEQALKIDPQLAEAHTALAYVKYVYSWDWKEAEKGFKKAIDYNPQYATAHQWYAEFLMDQGRFNEALSEIQMAKSLDPLSLIINAVESLVFYFTGDYDQAIKLGKKVVEMDAEFLTIHFWLYEAYHQSKLFNEEVRELFTLYRLTGLPEENISALEKIFSDSGHTALHQTIAQNMIANTQFDFGQNFIIAFESNAGNLEDQALEYLEKAWQDREVMMVRLKVERSFDNLRSHPRYKALMQKMGFEE